MVLSDEFIKMEMLAEKYVKDMSELKTLLQQGKMQESLSMVEALESSMQMTLAIGERYDLHTPVN